MIERIREFKYSEAKLARRLGLTRGDVKYLRSQLVEGDDWKATAANGEIALTENAAKKYVAGIENGPRVLAVGDCLIGSQPRKKNGVAPLLLLPPAPIKMRVVRKVQNPRVLDASDPHGAICHVIVGDSARYAYNAEFTALPSKQHVGFYEVVEAPQRSRW